jgi:hypothetical protein
MLYKNLPDEELQSVMRWRTLLDYIAALQMLILGRSYGEFKAVLKARRDFKAWKKDFLADRNRIQNNAKVNSPTGRTPISILWQYYAKGKRIFSQL